MSLRALLDHAAIRRVRDAAALLVSRDVAVLANAIAFNFLLCLFPLVVVVTALTARLPSGGRALSALLLVMNELIPFGRQPLVDTMRALTRTARGLQAVSLLVIVWGSSGIFIPVEMVLNHAWGGRTNRNFARIRVLAFLMTVFGGLLALGSVALTVLARSYSREWPLLARYGAKPAALLMTYVLFFAIYRFVPERSRSGAAAGAALWAAVAWEAVKYLFVIRLGTMHLEALYGPLAFAVSLVLWALVSSFVLVFGALMVKAPGASDELDPAA
jgi:membrane protein